MDEYVCLIVPAIDADTGVIQADFIRRERVTRCRDCAYAHPSPIARSEKLMCERFDEMFVSPDGFCAWGKPKEDAK